MEPISQMAGIADEIRLSIAPVFLLTALAGFTTILTGRLTRGIDRARTLAKGGDGAGAGPVAADGAANLALIRRRLRLLLWAIRCLIAASTIVCIVVILIFLGDYVLPDMSTLIAIMFILAMALIVTGLLLFFAEVGVTVRRLDTVLGN